MRLLTGLFCAALAAGQGEDLAAKSRQGKELMAAGRFQDAIPIYRDLVKALPGNPGPVLNLGLALHMSGSHREAIKEFREVLRLDPRSQTARLFLGTAFLALNLPAEAVRPLATVVRREPGTKEARLALGQAYLLLESYQPASEQFEELTALDPQNPKAWNGLGLSYEGLAARNFVEFEKKALGSAYWLLLVADARATVGTYTRAFLLYREALAKEPGLRGVHTAIADIYRKIGKPEWAAVEEEKERALPPLDCGEARPASAEGQRRKSAGARVLPARRLAEMLECDFRAGRFKQVLARSRGSLSAQSYFWRIRACNELARSAFLRLAELPPSAEAHELLATIQFNRRKYAESAAEWEAALKFAPGNPYYRFRLAIALSSGNQYEQAREILEDLLKQSPQSAELNFWLGFTLLGLLESEQAIPFLQKAVAADPAKPLAQKELGRAYVQSGQAEKAIPHLEAALPSDDDGSVRYQLAQAYRSVGRMEVAQEMLRKFREIEDPSGLGKGISGRKMEITPP
jgi:tetratricopeptide (TPR) repeat protein